METETDAALRVSARSLPKQERSRLRHSALLDAAEAVVVEAGIDSLRMREVARRAGLPIASVYHYFPSTAAIVRELSVRHLDCLGALLTRQLRMRLPPDATVEGRGDLVSAIIDDIAEFVFQTPAVTAIWSGLHANPDLRTLDIADTVRNAQHLRPYLRRLLPRLPAKQAQTMAIVLLQAVSANLMLALELPEPQRNDLVTSLKVFVASAVLGLK